MHSVVQVLYDLTVFLLPLLSIIDFYGMAEYVKIK